MNCVKVSPKPSSDDFWHKSDRWIYGVHTVNRNSFPIPPSDLDIDPDCCVVIMVDAKNPKKQYTVFPNQYFEYFDAEGKSWFTWRGVTAYPRLGTLGCAIWDRLCTGLPAIADQHQPDSAPCLVEACCDDDSLLSRKTRWSKYREVVPITEKTDFTSKKGIQVGINNITSKYDALWLSCPCTGGSMWVCINWARGERVRQKIREHWALFHRIWASFVVVAEHALKVGARVFIEWPRGCSYWREPCVMEFLAKHNFVFADFDGCMYGLVAKGGNSNKVGMPINKPWRVACSPNSSLPRFLNKKCDRSHQHTHCAGSFTKGTQSYTPEIVKQIHRSLNFDCVKEGGTCNDPSCLVGMEHSTSELDLSAFRVVLRLMQLQPARNVLRPRVSSPRFPPWAAPLARPICSACSFGRDIAYFWFWEDSSDTSEGKRERRGHPGPQPKPAGRAPAATSAGAPARDRRFCFFCCSCVVPLLASLPSPGTGGPAKAAAPRPSFSS